jgi:penicillin-binding protein 1A
VVSEGTGKSAKLRGIEVAGKTGTSNADSDKWFIGYTPRLLAGVWYGFEYPEALSDVKENVAARVWSQNMAKLHPVAENQLGRGRHFPTVPGVIRASYCRDSGEIPCEACRADLRGDRCSVGYFIQGTEPQARCNCHVLREYDVVQEGLADESTPPEQRKTVGLLRLTKARSLPRRIYVSDQKYCIQQ